MTKVPGEALCKGPVIACGVMMGLGLRMETFRCFQQKLVVIYNEVIKYIPKYSTSCV